MPRRGLSRADLVSAAARIADAEGLEAVTLARIAAELGVRPPSLYNHVKGLEELRRELALRGVEELGGALTRAAVGRSREDSLLAIAAAHRSYATEHPGTYAASVRAPSSDDAEAIAAADAALGVILAVLDGYGLEGQAALHAARGVRSALHGFVSLEGAGGFGIPLDRDASFEQMVSLLGTGLESQRAGPLSQPAR